MHLGRFGFALGLLVPALLACETGAGDALSPEPPACAAPAPPAAGIDDWAVASADSQGFDAPALCAVLAAVAAGRANVHAVVVERHGSLVAELYRAGRDRPIDVLYGLWNPFGGTVDFDAGTLHDTRSVSKSAVGLLFGVALRDGRIPGVAAPALDFFPELADLRTPPRDAILLQHLLSMSSGLAWDEGALPNDETRLFWKAEPARFLFDRLQAAAPGSVFHYDSGGVAALAEILVRTSGKPLVELARDELFQPLGSADSDWEWAQDLRDRPLAFTGLRMRPRDMAKLARLVLQRGAWKGRQVVPAEWVEDSLRQHVATGIRIPGASGGELGYGYLWWTGSVPWKGRALRWSAAFGNGGQRIYVVPELDLGVVTTAGDYGSAEIIPVVQRIFEDVVATVEEEPAPPRRELSER